MYKMASMDNVLMTYTVRVMRKLQGEEEVVGVQIPGKEEGVEVLLGLQVEEGEVVVHQLQPHRNGQEK